MVTTLSLHKPVTPDGKPEKVAPEAPVVVYEILVIALFTQSVCALVPAAELRVMVLLESVRVAQFPFQVVALFQIQVQELLTTGILATARLLLVKMLQLPIQLQVSTELL